METLDWHIRLINRLIKTNPDATIKDYFRITDGYHAPKTVAKKMKEIELTVENGTRNIASMVQKVIGRSEFLKAYNAMRKRTSFK